jgi:DNA polymerase III subunit epsilon
MTGGGWVIFVVSAAAQVAVLALLGWAMWDGLTAEQRLWAADLLQAAGGMPIVGVLALLGLLGIVVHLIFSRWVKPLRGIAEAARLIAMSNPKHRATAAGGAEVRELAGSVNLLAERYQALHEDVEIRIREANALLEEEKNTLSALMSKLTQGVLVCNPEGRILLYNPRAQRLLEGPARQSGAGDWIGLGRSVYGVIDESLIKHAIGNVRHRLECGDGNLLVPFVAPRPNGQLLSAHLVPILDHDRGLRGYILTFEDITRQFGAESRRGVLLQSLTEGQRSAIGGIRAAIETVLTFPEMDESGRQQFFEVIRDEALKVSQHLDRLEAEYGQELKRQLPFEQILGSDLLGAVERTLRDTRGRAIEVSAPVEPVWLKIDSYAIIQCLIFLVDQLREWCRADDLTLTLQTKRALASFELRWSGAVLHMEALRRWGMRNVSVDERTPSMSLFEVIEQHGGAVWPDPTGPDGRPCLRVILPVSELDAGAMESRSDEDYGHDFDFHLFEDRSEQRDLASLPLDRLSITVVDTETTGLDPDHGDEIIAIGAIRIVNGRILRRESFDSFVRPNRKISEEARAIHGISSDMLRAEPPIDEVLPRLRRFIEDTVIVGHNVDFDMRFFAAAGKSNGVVFSNAVLDTLLLEYALNPNQQDKSLEGIAARLGLQVTGRHTALGDALSTAEIFLALIPLLAERGIRTLGDAVAACKASPYARMTA